MFLLLISFKAFLNECYNSGLMLKYGMSRVSVLCIGRISAAFFSNCWSFFVSRSRLNLINNNTTNTNERTIMLLLITTTIVN